MISRLYRILVFIITSCITLFWGTNLPEIESFDLWQKKRGESPPLAFGVHVHITRLQRPPTWYGGTARKIMCVLKAVNAQIQSSIRYSVLVLFC